MFDAAKFVESRWQETDANSVVDAAAAAHGSWFCLVDGRSVVRARRLSSRSRHCVGY
jgi:hypothetical protein